MNRNRLGFAALALVAGSTGAFAQDATTGAILGTVRDTAGGAIARATVVIESNRGQLTYRTDADGQFRAASLIPGRYSVTVSADGYQSTGKLSVDVSLNLRTPLTVKLVKTGGAVVEVFASASRVDTTTQTSGTNFSSDTIQSLPLGRSFLAAVNLAPGVVDGGGTGTSNPSISGSSGLENQYLVDGVNTTSTGFGANGAYSRTYGSLGTGINSDFIQEVQVKSFGLDAEYGSALGGVVSAITRSGDNTFSGTAFLYLDIDSLQARDRVPSLESPTPTFNSRNRTELGFTVSGPIIKDKLFYFVGFNPITNETKRTAPANSDFAGRQSTEKTQNNAYYAKLNWLLATNHSMEFSFFGDPGKRAFGPQGDNDYYASEIGWSELKYGGRSASVKYNGTFGNDFFVEARVSDRSQEFQRIIDQRANSGWFYSDASTGIPLNPNAVGRYEKKLEDTNRQYEIKLTKSFGNFELKAGYTLENIGYDSSVSRSGPGGFADPHSAGAVYSSGVSVARRYMRANNALPFGANNIASYYRITRGNITPEAVKTDTDYSAYFIQGTYNYNNRLYIKAGVRFDEQTLKGTDINYKFKASDNVAPRISVTWDPAADGKSKIYGFFGRYYEKVPNDIAVRSLSAEVGVSRSDFRTFDTVNFNNLTNPILDGTSVYDVDPETGESTTDGEPTTTTTWLRAAS
ncbi:MAG: TonB-dependent receptor [Holophagaceae bacterium]|nr:TonB-dependent receptor [Holophagaceae bacterium]